MFDAAIWTGVELVIARGVSTRALRFGEVRVRVRRSGICHSDLNMMAAGGLVPMVLGHEAAGEIIEAAEDVIGWHVGDRVAISTQTPCGACRHCDSDRTHDCDETWGFNPGALFLWRGAPAFSFANVSAFAQEIVVRASQLVRIHALPYEQAALIGCAVSTGMAAAQVLGDVRADDRVAVFGIGGIGVNAIAGARLRGAKVCAIDVNARKEGIARHFGATAFIAAEQADTGETLADRLIQGGGPFDVAIECSGSKSAVEAAIAGVRRGGRVVLVGMGSPGQTASLPLDAVLLGRDIRATMNGGAVPARDYPSYVEAAITGALDIAAQVSGVWPLHDIHAAIAALRAGEVTRAVLNMD